MTDPWARGVIVVDEIAVLAAQHEARRRAVEDNAVKSGDALARCRPRKGRSDGLRNKIVFETQAAAQRAAAGLTQAGLPMKEHKCRRGQDHWHLATRKDRETP